MYIAHGREFCFITFLSFSHLCFDKVSESLFQKKMSSTVFEESPNKLGILRRFPARQLNSSRIKNSLRVNLMPLVSRSLETSLVSFTLFQTVLYSIGLTGVKFMNFSDHISHFFP